LGVGLVSIEAGKQLSDTLARRVGAEERVEETRPHHLRVLYGCIHGGLGEGVRAPRTPSDRCRGCADYAEVVDV
jgi:hypothetical protein